MGFEHIGKAILEMYAVMLKKAVGPVKAKTGSQEAADDNLDGDEEGKSSGDSSYEGMFCDDDDDKHDGAKIFEQQRQERLSEIKRTQTMADQANYEKRVRIKTKVRAIGRVKDLYVETLSEHAKMLQSNVTVSDAKINTKELMRRRSLIKYAAKEYEVANLLDKANEKMPQMPSS